METLKINMQWEIILNVFRANFNPRTIRETELIHIDSGVYLRSLDPNVRAFFTNTYDCELVELDDNIANMSMINERIGNGQMFRRM